MATCLWVGNGQNIAQTVTGTVTAAGGGVLAATINQKTVSYTCLPADTNNSAAAAFQALLAAASAAAPEFGDATWSVTNNVITATASNPGTPFAGMAGGLVFSGTGGAAVAQAQAVANSSQSDLANPANWLRDNAPALPQAGDSVVFANSSVPVLWNLTALQNVALSDVQRWQTMTGQIGLPDQNPAGYREYRTRHLYLNGGSAGSSSGGGPALTVELGLGPTGNNPGLERYNAQGQNVAWSVLQSGSPTSGNYAIELVGGGAGSTLTVINATVAVAPIPGQTASLASAFADGGATLLLGPGVTLTGTLTANNASAFLQSAPASLIAQAGAQVTANTVGATFPAASADGGSSLTWLADGTVASLTLTRGSTFDKSQDVRPLTVVSSAVDRDCTILDPNGAITFQKATTVNGQVTSGPFQIGQGSGPARTVKIT